MFAFEGEGGLTPGAVHETLNTAWGLGLDNLYYIIDWNDYGIDDTPISAVVAGSPESGLVGMAGAWSAPVRVLNGVP